MDALELRPRRLEVLPGHECRDRYAPVVPLPERDRLDAAMRLALDEARAALDHDDVPVGAVVLAPDGEVVARGHNEREQRHDPTAHAEILALRDAAAAARSWRLDGHVLVVTLEPCAMCAAAAVQARLAGVVFGAADPKGGALGSLYNLAADPRLHHEIPVTPGVMAGEAAVLLTRFFEERRGRGEGPEPVE